MPTIRRIALAGVLLAAALTPAASAQNQLVVAELDRATPISAAGSGVVWSKRDQTGMFRLWFSQDGSPGDMVPVEGRRVPFDADLGLTADGGTRAVYSRCRIEPPFDPVRGVPDYTRGRGCDLYWLDLSTGTERLIPRASTRGASEVLPAVWANRIAFARRRVGSPARLYTGPLRGRGAFSRLPGGRRGTAARPTALDLHGRRFAFAWASLRAPGAEETSVDLVDVRTRTHTLLDSDPGGSASAIALRWPAFENGKLFYARACVGNVTICASRAALVRYKPVSDTFATAPIGFTDVAHTRGAGVTYLLRDRLPTRACFDPAAPEPRAPTCQLLLTTPTFR